MKKLGLIVTATLFSAVAFAQTPATMPASATKLQMKNMRRNIHSYDEKKPEAIQAEKNRAAAATSPNATAVTPAKADIQTDTKVLKTETVKQPANELKSVKADSSKLKPINHQ